MRQDMNNKKRQNKTIQINLFLSIFVTEQKSKHSLQIAEK